MAVRKILMLKKEGKIWTFLLENDVIAEIHCSLPDSDQHRQPVLGYLHRKSKKYRGEYRSRFYRDRSGKRMLLRPKSGASGDLYP